MIQRDDSLDRLFAEAAERAAGSLSFSSASYLTRSTYRCRFDGDRPTLESLGYECEASLG